MSVNVIEVDNLSGPDCTTYEEPEYLVSLSAASRRYSGALTILYKSKVIEARALACSAYRGEFTSVTLRSDAENRAPTSKSYEDWVDSGLKKYIEKRSADQSGTEPKLLVGANLKDYIGYCPPDFKEYSPGPRRKAGSSKAPPRSRSKHGDKTVYVNSIHKICSILQDLLINQTGLSDPTGLIAITGATDASKSLITRGLIFLIMREAARTALSRKQRKPHLITFEDPIERYFIRDPVTKGLPKLPELKSLLDAFYMDYTPRERPRDADSLKEVLQDALRQTPALLFIGETRDKDDWKDLLDFSGSGHLVLTTSHASSVVEAMSAIFRDTGTKTSSQRSEIARRIVGMVNVRSYTPPNSLVRALVPSLWKRTSQSMNNLVADGLASIVPARDREDEIGYYGRTYFADQLVKPGQMTEEMEHLAPSPRQEALKAIKKRAWEWDIKGE